MEDHRRFPFHQLPSVDSLDRSPAVSGTPFHTINGMSPQAAEPSAVQEQTRTEIVWCEAEGQLIDVMADADPGPSACGKRAPINSA